MKLNQSSVITFDKLDGELKYYGDGFYQLILNQFKMRDEDDNMQLLSVFLYADQVPDQFKDEEQIFEVGEHVDKVIHELHGNYASGNPVGYPEYVGEIIKIVNKNEGKLNSPRRWVYTVRDDRKQYYQDSNFKQWELALAINPQTD